MSVGLKATITEAQFTRMVLRLAWLFGWRSAHFRPGRTKRGWRTAVMGDGAGWPDLLLLRGPRLVVAELKVGRRKPTPAQLAWLEAFGAVGAEAYLWHPGDWGEIEKVLGRKGE